jgi:hypothetical protein
MGYVILTTCDECKKEIKHNTHYYIVFHRIKGSNANVEPTKSICEKCYEKR